jgi:hypothetical protein
MSEPCCLPASRSPAAPLNRSELAEALSIVESWLAEVHGQLNAVGVGSEWRALQRRLERSLLVMQEVDLEPAP